MAPSWVGLPDRTVDDEGILGSSGLDRDGFPNWGSCWGKLPAAVNEREYRPKLRGRQRDPAKGISTNKGSALRRP